MEDKVFCNPNLTPESAFFGVYDGHSGVEAADYLVDNLHKHLIQFLSDDPEDIEGAFTKALVKADADVQKINNNVGSTVVAAFLRQEGDKKVNVLSLPLNAF